MSSTGNTLGSAFPRLPFVYPHAGCSRMGSFRRAWVVRELDDTNWNRSGVLYRDGEGRTVYATVVAFEQHGEPGWQISRHIYEEGRLRRGPTDRFRTLEAAIGALNAEARASRARFGWVPRHEWPQDADTRWIVYSARRRPGGAEGGAQPTFDAEGGS